MDTDSKLENKIQMLLKKREKHHEIIRTETNRLKKTNEEIVVLETKKRDRLMKTLFDNLQKEGIGLDVLKVDEIVNMLKEKQGSEDDLDLKDVNEEISNQEQAGIENSVVPIVPAVFRN